MRRGEVIAGKYRLVRELGAGAQARVWEAIHLQIGTPLAVKMLDPGLADKDEYVSRFQREASAAAALRSSHVVQIFDFGVSEGVPYIAMELLEGEDLAKLLLRQRRLEPVHVARIVTQIARALDRAHRRGIVHRDLKPHNIFLCAADEGEPQLVKVLDFGIAKVLDAGGVHARTHTGVVLGTPYYMSPEQAQGSRQVDFRADLWSLGVITFEALLGCRPFEATNLADLLVKICKREPPVPSQVGPVPEGFDQWFAKAVAREPEQRFESAKHMASSLALVCESAVSSTAGAPYEIAGQASYGRDPFAESPGLTMNDAPGDNDPTQVMSSLPAGMVQPFDTAQIDPCDEPTRELPHEALSATRVMAKRFPPPPPAQPEEDAVQLFRASQLAVDLAAEQQRLDDEARSKARRDTIRAFVVPLLGLVALLIVTLAIALWR